MGYEILKNGQADLGLAYSDARVRLMVWFFEDDKSAFLFITLRRSSERRLSAYPGLRADEKLSSLLIMKQ